MESNEQEDVIVDDLETTNEEVPEYTEETLEDKPEKPKRTPQEEYDYYKGRADRLAKKLGIVSKEESNTKPESKPNINQNSSKPNDFDYGEKAFLKTYGIQGSDELTLVKNFRNRTGDDLDTIVSDEIFVGKLKSLREAKESANAIPKGKNRVGMTGNNDVDIAIAKFKETGELPSNFELRKQVVDKAIVEPSKNINKSFS